MSEPTRCTSGFTLIELLMVLIILVAMMAVTVPYASRSNEGLLLEGACRDMAETVVYAVDLAGRTRRCVRLTLDVVENWYMLAIADDRSANEFVPVDDGQRMVCFMSPKVRVVDAQGFEPSGKARYCLLFDPSQAWPAASVSLAAGNAVKNVAIVGRSISIEDASN